MARPKIFHGRTIGVKIRALMDIRIKALAQERERTESEVVREALEIGLRELMARREVTSPGDLITAPIASVV